MPVAKKESVSAAQKMIKGEVDSLKERITRLEKTIATLKGTKKEKFAEEEEEETSAPQPEAEAEPVLKPEDLVEDAGGVYRPKTPKFSND